MKDKLKLTHISSEFVECAFVGCAKIVPFERTLVAVQSLNRRWVCRQKHASAPSRRRPRALEKIQNANNRFNTAAAAVVQ